MATKTLIPALKAKVGNWPYFICSMKYGAVAREVNFAHELNNGNRELTMLIQRGLSERTADIVKYLLSTEGRFLGAMIVAAWGGDPLYHPVKMQDPEGLLVNLDSDFGVLEFNGSQQYFALDGQHRLKAIKDSLKQNPDLGSEDICVLIVSHFDTEDGRKRTRRLFTNINKHAKKTTKAEDIALDEDDGVAIITRRLLMEHPFLKHDGRVRVITSSDAEGGLKLATGNVSKGDQSALFTMGGVYEIVKDILEALELPIARLDATVRPPDDMLEASYDKVSAMLDELLVCCGDIRNKLEGAASARDIRAPKHDEGLGHPFMRAMIQRAVSNFIKMALSQKWMTWEQVRAGLSALTWQLDAPPWCSVTAKDEKTVKMLTQRDYSNLLEELLVSHLAPRSKAAVQRARSEFRKLHKKSYDVSEEELTATVREDVDLGTPAPSSSANE